MLFLQRKLRVPDGAKIMKSSWDDICYLCAHHGGLEGFNYPDHISNFEGMRDKR
jgi:hypothetical protein